MANYIGHFEDSNGNVILPTPHSYTSVIETSMSATQPYVVGQIITICVPGELNHLYRITAAIATNDLFVVGTNIEEITVSNINEQLTAPNGVEFTLQDLLDGVYN